MIGDDNKLMAILSRIEINQNNLLENQKLLTEKIGSEFLLQKDSHDKLYKMMKVMKPNRKCNEVHEKGSIIEELAGKFKFPLSTVEDVFSFNKEIGSNENYRKYLMDCFTSIGGNDGNAEGKIVAKQLRTVLFTERVLTLFSWTGVSRTPGMPKKESFQLCENITNLFFDLIVKADNHWNATKNEKFFKYNTLKHAKQNEKASDRRKKAGEDKTDRVINIGGCSQDQDPEPETEASMESTEWSEVEVVMVKKETAS